MDALMESAMFYYDQAGSLYKKEYDGTACTATRIAHQLYRAWSMAVLSAIKRKVPEYRNTDLPTMGAKFIELYNNQVDEYSVELMAIFEDLYHAMQSGVDTVDITIYFHLYQNAITLFSSFFIEGGVTIDV